MSTSAAARWLADHGIAVAANTVRLWCSLKRLASARTPGGQYRVRVSALRALVDDSIAA